MFKVAICDDDKYICRMIADALNEYVQKDIIKIDLFYAADDFYKQIVEGECFDLVYLDIIFDSMDGISAGKNIRNLLKNEYMHIAYISGKESYAMDLFEIRPLNFLIKPFTKDKVIEVLEKAMYLSGVQRKTFDFKIDKTYYKVPYNEILYFESNARKVIIHTVNETFAFYGRMNEITEVVDKDFVRIHQSYLINTAAVSEYRYDSIVLHNKTVLNISKAYRSLIRERIISNWREK